MQGWLSGVGHAQLFSLQIALTPLMHQYHFGGSSTKQYRKLHMAQQYYYYDPT